jgi:hypothetical protein
VQEIIRLNSISIFPYYGGIVLEVEALLENGVGHYVIDQSMDQTSYTLEIENAQMTQQIHVGMSYYCAALAEDDTPMKTHWLYCTSIDSALTFGVLVDWAKHNSFAPALPSAATALVRHEELSDLVAIFPSPAPEGSLAQAQIGKRGWLVSQRIHSPFSMGFLIDNPTLPTAFCVGMQNLTVTARSRRTLQTICIGALLCVSIKDTALFLRRGA